VTDGHTYRYQALEHTALAYHCARKTTNNACNYSIYKKRNSLTVWVVPTEWTE